MIIFERVDKIFKIKANMSLLSVSKNTIIFFLKLGLKPYEIIN